ncbi:transcriptional regulator [Opitutaceae bacterium TAV1]|nr:transcriptional regulator [Opitutaceae bacterium TAV1]
MIRLQTATRSPQRAENRAGSIYTQIKEDIAALRLLPGDRFTETDVAARMRTSRTPVREALFRLQREGHVEVLFRNGWQVRPFDFRVFEELYDVRILLETAAVARLCAQADNGGTFIDPAVFADLKRVWLVPENERLQDAGIVAGLDERFHEKLVEATGNREMALIHHDITERIRIVRRLDFTKPERIAATYAEHGRIIEAILRKNTESAQALLRTHIDRSKAEVRRITLHMLQTARG